MAAHAKAAAVAAIHPRATLDTSMHPPMWLRNGHAQSILPSVPWRRPAVERRAAPLLAASHEWILECGDGVLLQAFHTPAADLNGGTPRLAVLLHGWEGCADSLYILSLAQALYDAGFEVVRLNLRDHGDTHHLNRELFHSCRLPEVLGALRTVQQRGGGRPLDLVGFSLGGNFMLRAAAEAQSAQLTLRSTIAISPVIDPARTLDALESPWSVYHRYFIRKWVRSLAKKQAAWPGQFDFSALDRMRSLRPMTAALVLEHTQFPSLDDYLAGYAITGERLALLAVPSWIIASLDDPIIPPSDLERLAAPPTLQVILAPHGGHCGFFERLTEASWADRVVLRVLGEVH
jgi:hypothetical protein